MRTIGQAEARPAAAEGIGSPETGGRTRRWFAALGFAAAMAGSAWAAAGKGIPLEKWSLPAGKAGVQIRPVLTGEIRGVSTDQVFIVGPGQHVEPAHAKEAVVWLILEGKATMLAGTSKYEVQGETIARAPQGVAWQINVAQGEMLRAVRIRRELTADDLAELKKFPQNNAAPLVKKFSECTPYGEAIKSPKTVSRTLLPENYVPRMAVGTVETTGPDTVGRHKHPMLEQIFLGLKGNDITVLADEHSANLTEFSILHIPLGSNHGAEVAGGKKLHYIWMDFFIAKEGQEYLKNHLTLDPGKKK
ncbi:MAG: cupin domain-containing protein [Acidobacteria bacterium]|nr:cupin domain-containing protein [Acidobacteriota bacterium]